MKKKLFVLILSILFIPTIIFSYSPLPDKKIKIAATTSNLSTLLNEICKDKIDVITIIPTTMCPGSYDIDAKTIKEIKISDVDNLIKNEVITGGMIPKINSCKQAVEKGVKEVLIIDGVSGIKKLNGTVIKN